MLSRARTGALALLLLSALATLALLNDSQEASAHHLCGNTGSPAGPFAMEAYEAADHRNVYARSLELAGFNQLFPEHASFAVPRLETGYRDAGSGQLTDGYIPPVILKAIAWIESGWAQASYDPPVQYGEAGPALISHDCGYGLMQVTSGMQNITGVPNLEQAMIGGHYAFNIARGARILADKWNMGPEFRPLVGNRAPYVIENWYFALWGYNGFAFKNHPLNPTYDSNRPPFDCQGDTPRNYPYQELVLGCVANPPAPGGVRLWEPVEVHLPDRNDPAVAEALNVENWEPCSLRLECAPMDIATPNPSNMDPVRLDVTRAQVIGSPALAVSAGQLDLVAIPPAVEAQATVTIANAGSGPLAWRASASAPWLKLSRNQGVGLNSDLGPHSSTVTVRAEAGNLPPGTYSGEVKIDSMYASGAPHVIRVTFRNHADDTLVQGSGPAVYAMKDGLRRQIPDPPTLGALGYSWGNIVRVSDEALSSIPRGNPLPSILADGTLLQAQGGAAVYSVQGGDRRHVRDPGVMAACGYRWDAIRLVPAEVIGSIAEGEPLGGQPCPQWTPLHGTLIRGDGDPVVYEVLSGVRRAFRNIASFQVRGGRWGNVDVLPPGLVAGVPRGRDLPDALADGRLLKGSAPNVYVMSGGARRHVTGPEVMAACGYGFDALQFVSDGTMAELPVAASLREPPCPRFIPEEGALILGSDGYVYQVNGGEKRHVPNLETFAALGFNWADVDRFADSIVAAVPAGPPLPDVTRDGTLIRGSGPAVFVLDDGYRRLVTDPSVMDACAYSWGSVLSVPDATLAAIPLAAHLAGPPCP